MNTVYRFDFGPGAAASGYDKASAAAVYSGASGFGFTGESVVYARDRGTGEPLSGDFCIPTPGSFRVDVPNGNYNVHVLIGDEIAPTYTTVRFGPRRMAVPSLATTPGQFVRRSFSVHVDDGVLMLHISGKAPRINALEIERTEQATTVFLAGDSTVADQGTFPYAGWGQMLPAYLKTDAAVANHASSGRSSKSFIAEGRLDAILKAIKPKDFLFIQFGHNDQKSDEERHTDPGSTYEQHLLRYIEEARARQAIPVLITSVERRLFDSEGQLRDSHGEYLNAVRRLAATADVPLIDLAAKSRLLLEQLGDEPSKSLFMWSYPGEYVDFPDGAQDNTHFNELGGLRMAQLVAEGIRELNLSPLSLYLR